jgi:NAD+ kinase
MHVATARCARWPCSRHGARSATSTPSPWCEIRDIDAVALDEPLAEIAEQAIVVALGGDGTVLRAAAWVAKHGLPILGANLGSLGFLTQTDASTLTQALEAILRDAFDIEERMRIAYTTPHGTATALNEVLVRGRPPRHFCELELRSQLGVVASFPGDGLIISTSTGSTAYSLSAGGPVIVPPAACLLATPLAAHKLGVRPIVFPAEEPLQIRLQSAALAFADGDRVGELDAGQEVTIARAETPTRLIRLRDAPTFFRVLETKLNWSDDRPRFDRPTHGSCGDTAR